MDTIYRIDSLKFRLGKLDRCGFFFGYWKWIYNLFINFVNQYPIFSLQFSVSSVFFTLCFGVISVWFLMHPYIVALQRGRKHKNNFCERCSCNLFLKAFLNKISCHFWTIFCIYIEICVTWKHDIELWVGNLIVPYWYIEVQHTVINSATDLCWSAQQ